MKDLEELCTSKMPGSKKFDKFWVQVFVTKNFKSAEQVQFIVKALDNIKDTDTKKVEDKFDKIIEKIIEKQQSAQKAKAAQKAEEEKEKEKKELAEDLGGWGKEEVALLTKAIVRFPPGTVQRWKVIAEFVGTRTMKEVIKKA